ncbi:uncharacterized protein A4U43_C03F21790 [Asparagus officinalis]|uniref:Uncharacterized protein n=1 Tax=Asparagus officinalis TaxID=4686 RepID=A0A5P1FCX9_ASPOF|nr:uncharacterized protein A4U43_C03F21790 [Asparagus officinalis]
MPLGSNVATWVLALSSTAVVLQAAFSKAKQIIDPLSTGAVLCGHRQMTEVSVAEMSFSMNRKKTPFQKHREEEEAKKKRAEDKTARLYAEFVESFQANDEPGSKPSIRGGLINPNEKLKADSEGRNSKDGLSVPKKGTR